MVDFTASKIIQKCYFRLKEDQGNFFMYPERPIETNKRKELPPLGLKIFKGEREMALSR